MAVFSSKKVSEESLSFLAVLPGRTPPRIGSRSEWSAPIRRGAEESAQRIAANVLARAYLWCGVPCMGSTWIKQSWALHLSGKLSISLGVLAASRAFWPCSDGSRHHWRLPAERALRRLCVRDAAEDGNRWKYMRGGPDQFAETGDLRSRGSWCARREHSRIAVAG